MAIAWPAGFRPPARESYAYTTANLLQRTGFAHGSRVRRLYSDDSDSFSSVTLNLSPGQWAEFQGWIRYVAKDCAEWIAMPILTAGDVQVEEVRIIPPLRYELIGIRSARVTFAIETRVGTAPDEEFYDWLIEMGGGDAAFKFADLLDHAMNKQIPSFAQDYP